MLTADSEHLLSRVSRRRAEPSTTSSPILTVAPPLRPGLGLKNFRGNYWEIRVDLHDRIIFELTDRVRFWLVGNHDEIRAFMKSR